jgi:hypothetical protein
MNARLDNRYTVFWKPFWKEGIFVEEEGTVYSSQAPGFTPVFGGLRVAYLFSFNVVLCFLFFFFLCLEHNVVCVSGLSTLWLPLRFSLESLLILEYQENGLSEIDMIKIDCTFESVNIFNPSNINHSFFPQPLASYGTEMFVVIPQIRATFPQIGK